jgi:hypothetical protein
MCRRKSRSYRDLWKVGEFKDAPRTQCAITRVARPSHLEAFHFSDEPAGGDRGKRVANSMIETIVGELKREP